MTLEENPFGDLLQDYIVECLPLAEEVGHALRRAGAPLARR